MEKDKEQAELSLSGYSSELDYLFDLLHREYQINFSQYRQSTIQRRLIRRISLSRSRDLPDYIDYLEKNVHELEALYNDFLLNFTEFFRDPAVFSLLKETIFPRIIEKKTVKTALRIWVPGCSTGEEVYSLAICLHEYLEEQKIQIPLQFFGTDLVDANVQTARRAFFPPDIEKHVSRERLSRFFDSLDQGYKVTRFIREQCAFSVQDLIHDPPFPRIDLISCRNVLIYLNESLQDRILPLFHYSLSSEGYLLLGTSESMGRYADLFSRPDNQHNIFRKRQSSGNRLRYQSLISPMSRGKSSVPNLGERKREEPSKLRISDRMDRILLKHYTPPSLLVDGSMRIRQFRGDLNPFLKPSEGEASLLLSKMLPKGWLPDFIVTMEEAKKGHKPVKRTGVLISDGTENKKIDYSIIPLEPSQTEDPLFCLIFESLNTLEDEVRHERNDSDEGDYRDENCKLKKELELIKSHLQTIIEEKEEVNQELWSANEEIQSTNEELLSVNEELEAAKEELESSNEELLTLNEELNHKNKELEDLVDENAKVLEILGDSQKIAHLGTWWIDLPGSTVSLTEESALICGFDNLLKSVSLDELGGRVHSEDRDRVINLLTELPSKGDYARDSHFSFVAQMPEGSVKHIDATRKILRNDEGKPVRVSGTIQDVTLKVMAELELKRSESFLSSVFYSIQDGISVLDRDLNVLQVNPVMEQWYADSLPLEGKKCFNCFQRSDSICTPCPSVRALKSGSVETNVVAGPAGSHIKWVELFSYPLSDPNSGDVTGVVEFARDVTAKINTESALEESEARLRQYMEATPVGIVVLDREGRLIDINGAACGIFNMDKEEGLAAGGNLFSRFNVDDKDLILSLEREGSASGEIHHTTDSGKVLFLLFNAVKLTDKGEYLYFIIDVTGQKEMEIQLHQTEKMQVVGQLAGGIAHDFNNQLTGIMGYTDVIRSELPPDSEFMVYLDSIINIVNRASDLTSQLLAFSRKGKYQAIKVDLHRIIEEVVNLLTHSLDKKIVIRQNLTAEDCLTMGDPTQLQNMILNLALNARDAMPGGGTLTFESQRKTVQIPPAFFKTFEIGPGHYLVISIIDTGQGIAEDHLERIFEPFFTTKSQGKGTGMGLAAVYGTVKNHYGAIEVNSAKDKGSQFSIYLPCCESDHVKTMEKMIE